MQRFRFVHAADLHLDTPFEGIRGVAPEVGRALREASLDAFDALVELCLEQEAAFLLIAGDVYDGAERGLRAQLRFRAGLERLAAAGVRVFVVHGNHDPSEEGWSAIREWPEGVTVFGPERVAGVPLVRAGERLATVYGISYGRRDVHENLSLAFPRDGRARQGEDGLRVGLLHCNAGGNTDHAPYAACSLSDLVAADIDYWALGHVHGRRILAGDAGADAGGPWVVYPGNLQGRSPHPAEQGAKGAYVVEAETRDGAARVREVRFHAVDRVRFLSVALDVSSHVDLGQVERELQQRADALRAEHPDRGLVLCASLSGRSAVAGDLARLGAGDLLDSLRDGRRGEQPFTWWGSLTSQVGRPIDRDALRERDDFGAQLLALADELAEAPDALQRFAREAFAELPDELKGVELPALQPDELLPLLRRAEESALERVADDEPPGGARR
jgi:DNA repair exonuclease SbcCD nuclease subunit